LVLLSRLGFRAPADMPYATAKSLRPDAIPVIDIAALRDGTDVKAVSAALHSASQGLGFIYIKGHGIPESTLESARRVAFEFFRQTDRAKASVSVSPQHRGWLKPGGAKMGDEAKTDLKESFIWGQQDSQGRSLNDHPLRGANRWPEEFPEFEAAAMAYFDHAHRVANYLMQGFADFGVLTVLCQDDTGGLQVEDINGEWIHAPPVEGTLIVNVGDLLSRWTAGEYKSTPHRVVNASGRERLSLVLAFDPNPETLIDANQIPGLTAKEPAIRCGDYLQWRFAKAFSYRKATPA